MNKMLSMKRTDTLGLLIISISIGQAIFTIPLLLTLEPFQNLMLLFLNSTFLPLLGIFGLIIAVGLIGLGLLIDKVNRKSLIIR